MTIINTVAGSSAKLAQKEVVPTSFPTVVEPPEGYDGLSKATVNAPENLSAENIKAGVDIAGVVGGYDPQPNLDTVTLTLTVLPTTVVADAGYDGLKRVNVKKPETLVPENVKKNISIAGVTGTYAPKLQFQSMLPTQFPEEVTPDDGYDGLSVVRINTPTNLEAQYIRKGVTIAGITGIYGGPLAFDANGRVQTPDMITEDMFPHDGPVIALGDYAFYKWGVRQVALPYYFTDIGTSSFERCDKLETLGPYNYINNVGKYAFRYCTSLTSIRLIDGKYSKGPYTIGQYAFQGCTSLTTMTIPATYDTMSAGCFAGCSALTSLIMKPTNPPILGAAALDSTPSSLVITVPKGTLSKYKSATNWSQYASKMVEASE